MSVLLLVVVAVLTIVYGLARNQADELARAKWERDALALTCNSWVRVAKHVREQHEREVAALQVLLPKPRAVPKKRKRRAR